MKHASAAVASASRSTIAGSTCSGSGPRATTPMTCWSVWTAGSSARSIRLRTLGRHGPFAHGPAVGHARAGHRPVVEPRAGGYRRGMDIVIAGGHGQIALHLERLLADAGHQVRGLVRNPDHAPDLE